MRNLELKLKHWLEHNADSGFAQVVLFVVAFLEASVFPLPPSIVLLGMVGFGGRSRWIYLATLTTLASVLGGIFGYLVGSVLYDTLGIWIIETYNLTDDVARIGELFAKHAFFANFIAAVTPIPYKAFTIASGFFAINIIPFILASLIGRGLRFYVVAYFGDFFHEHFMKHFALYAILGTVAAVALILFFVLF